MSASRSYRRRRGSTLVMVAFMLVAIMAVTAIALDLGRFYVVNNELQTALDAGALAGAQRMSRSTIPLDRDLTADIRAHVVSFVAAANKVDNEGYSVVPDSVRLAYWGPGYTEPDFEYADDGKRANAVVIRYRKNPPPIFAGIIGRSAPTLWKRSVAWVATINSMNCVRPWALPYGAFYKVATGSAPPALPALAPSLTPDQINDFLDNPESQRLVTIVGQNQATTLGNDGEWTGFNFTGNAGRPGFVDGLQGCRIYEVGTSAADGVTLPGQANQYVGWASSVMWKNVGGGGGGPGSDGPKICYQRVASDAGCYADATSASLGVPGVDIHVAWGDYVSTGSNAVDFRIVTHFKLLCYFESTSTTCPVTPYGRPASGYPPGSIVGLVYRLGSPIITPETVLGNEMGTETKLVLVK